MKFLSPIDVDGYISLITQNPGVTPTKFLIQDANGRIAFRTGQELKVDIGADYTSVLKHQVKAGVAINKGQAVYVTSADGTNMIVGLASNATEATSSKTMGLLSATVAANGFADVITEGLLAGLNTIGANAGDPVWLGTNGNLIYGLANKPYAPNHLVFIGIVTRVNANNGEIFVKAQNGFELDEIHDVDLKTTTKVNGHLLGYNGSLWVNKTIAEWLGYTPYNASNPAGYITSSGSITGNAATATNADYANAAGTASTATNANYLSILGGSGGNLNTMPYGRYYNYGSGSYWINGPSGMSYGSVYNFGGSSESVLSLQLAADINHNSTSSTRTMWFRTGNNLGFQNDWKEVLHSGNYSSFAVPLSRTITINGTSYDLSANRSWTVTANAVETDTLATVTGRGATTSTRPSFDGGITVNGQSYVTNSGYFVSATNGFRWNDSSGVYNNVIMRDNGTTWFRDYLETSSSMRAPIFYDVNNTGYYLDPASTSNISVLSVSRAYAGYDAGQADSFSCSNWFRSSGSSGWFNATYTGGWYMIDSSWVRSYNDKGIYTGGTIQSGSQMQSPIFYDANDTSYYINPNGDSRLSRTYIGNYTNYMTLGAWDGVNNRIEAVGQPLFLTSYGGPIKFGYNGSSQMELATNGTLLVNSQLSLGNTTNTKIKWGGNTTPTLGLPFTAATNALWLEVNDGDTGGVVIDNEGVTVYGAGDAGYVFRVIDEDVYQSISDVAASTTFYVATGQNGGGYMRGILNVTDYLTAGNSARAPIFYDSNNTGYYVDPASGSNLYDLALSGGKHTYLYINPGNGYEAMVRYNGGSGNTWYAGKRTTGTAQAGTDGFHFYSDAGGDTVVGFGTDGTIRGKGDVVAYSSSDKRLKENITPIENALEKVKQIGGYTFDWNNKQTIYEGHDVGVIAQEIESVLPEIVTTRDTGFKAVKYEKIVPLLIEAIKEQQTQIEELKQLVNQLINK